MKRALFPLLLTLIIITACTPSPQPTQTPTPQPEATMTKPPTPTTSPVTTTPSASITPVMQGVNTKRPYAFERNQRLGRGVNLGNALEAPTEGEWGVVLEESYFQLIQDAGFDSVRLPVRWNAHAMLEAPYTIDPEFFKRVDWAIDMAFKRDLAVVLNIHHYLEMMSEPEKNQERFLALWDQIARHYQSYSKDLYFELINEPNTAFNWFLVNQITEVGIKTIRASNPERIIIVGPADWFSINALDAFKLPAKEPNLIVSVHYYEPFHFTHQGAEWAEGSDAWMGTQWTGSDTEKESINQALNLAAAYGSREDRPIYLGEFGAYSKADMDSRARWTDYVARQAEARAMSWAYWEFCAGFGVYDPVNKVWVEAIKKALVP